MNTKTQERTNQQPAQESTSRGQLVVRPQYDESFREEYNINPNQFRVLTEAIWPTAQTAAAIKLALAYCRHRNLDPMKKPIHIVPIYNSALKKMVESIWPGIAELRTTATRTQSYAGCDLTVFGSEIDFIYVIKADDRDPNGKDVQKTLRVPEWAQITVYRIVQGQRVPFPGPKVFWKEAYATKSNFTDEPNTMWGTDRTWGQLEKCAEAAALRKAFPEELGGEMSAEEMWGKTIEGTATEIHDPQTVKETPPRPARSDFSKKPAPARQQQQPRQQPQQEEPPATNQSDPPASGDQPSPTPPNGARDTKPAETPAVKKEPQTSLRAKADTFSDWLADAYDELETITQENLIDPLQDQVSRELEGEQLEQWTLACNTRARTLMQSRRSGGR